jgi:hypothetical protein
MFDKINGWEVMLAEKRGDEIVFLARQDYDSLHFKYVVSYTLDGKTWTQGSYFHTADYGGAQDAYDAAKLCWLYRAGYASFFRRLKLIATAQSNNNADGFKWALRGLVNLKVISEKSRL